MKSKQVRVTPVPRVDPKLRLLARALLMLVAQQEAEAASPKPETEKRKAS